MLGEKALKLFCKPEIRVISRTRKFNVNCSLRDLQRWTSKKIILLQVKWLVLLMECTRGSWEPSNICIEALYFCTTTKFPQTPAFL